jgi:outer membrane protein TolC
VAACAVLILVAVTPTRAQETETAATRRTLTLDQALALGKQNGAAIQLARARANAAVAHHEGARLAYLPILSAEGSWVHNTANQQIIIPAGAIGIDGTGALLPSNDRVIGQSRSDIAIAALTVTQPITDLYRVHQAAGLAGAQRVESEAARAGAEADVAFAVQQLYLGLLVARAEHQAALAACLAATERSFDVNVAVATGTELIARASEARAAEYQAAYDAQQAEDRLSDLAADLNQLIGLPLDTELELISPSLEREPLADLDAYVAAALDANHEVREARARLDQAKHGVGLVRADLLPSVALLVTQSYQNGIDLMPKNNVVVGLRGSWTPFDFGKRRANLREREAQASRAQIALDHTERSVRVAVEKAYRAAARAEAAERTALAALAAARDAEHVAADQVETGTMLASTRSRVVAASLAAEASALEAGFGVILARADLMRIVGRSEP